MSMLFEVHEYLINPYGLNDAALIFIVPVLQLHRDLYV